MCDSLRRLAFGALVGGFGLHPALQRRPQAADHEQADGSDHEEEQQDSDDADHVRDDSCYTDP